MSVPTERMKRRRHFLVVRTLNREEYRGAYCLQVGQKRVTDSINVGPPFIILTEVTVEATKETLPFLAINRYMIETFQDLGPVPDT